MGLLLCRSIVSARLRRHWCPRFESAVGVMSRCSRGNRAVAFTVSKVILARWVVFKTFIEVPKSLEKSHSHNQPFQFLFIIEDKRQQLYYLFRSINAGQDGGGNQGSWERDQDTGSCGLLRVVVSHPSHLDSNTLQGEAAKGEHPLATVPVEPLESPDTSLGRMILSLANQSLRIPDRKKTRSDEL